MPKNNFPYFWRDIKDLLVCIAAIPFVFVACGVIIVRNLLHEIGFLNIHER